MISAPGMANRDGNDCYEPYSWWVCNYNGQRYEGCCNTDPCQSTIGCPTANQQPASSIQSMSSIPPPSLASLSSESTTSSPSAATQSPIRTATGPTAGVTATAAASETPGVQPPQISTLPLPVGALAGIVVGSFLLAVFLGVWLCMWRGNRQRTKGDERGNSHSRSALEKRATTGNGTAPFIRRSEQTNIPDEAPEPFSPAACVPDILRPGMGIYIRDSQTTQSSGHPRSTLISPITPTSVGTNGLMLQHPELDSTPITELDSSPRQSELAELASQAQDRDKNWPIRGDGPSSAASPPLQLTQEAVDRPRATLNSTKYERDSGTYANSWTRFHNIQL